MNDAIKLRGRIEAQFINEDGSVETLHFKNSVRDALREAVAAGIALEPTAYPTQIVLGNSAVEYRAYRGDTDYDDDVVLNATTQQQIAQGATFINGTGNSKYVRGVRVKLKRLGATTGSLTMEMRVQSASLPTTLIATSSPVACASLSTSFDWVTFWFDEDNPPDSILSNVLLLFSFVLKSSGYTYSAGVDEIRWATDSSSPTTGTKVTLCMYDGATWTTSPGTDGGLFQVLFKAHPDCTTVFGYDGTGTNGTLQYKSTISGRSRQNKIAARLMASFGKSTANEFIGWAGLLDSNDVLCAIANVSFTKTSAQILNVYWIIEVE